MNTPDNHTAVILAIAGAALVTYSLRLGGLLLSEHLPRSGRFKRFMETLPGTIMVALVAPACAGGYLFIDDGLPPEAQLWMCIDCGDVWEPEIVTGSTNTTTYVHYGDG